MKKVLHLTLIMFGIVTLFTYIAWHMGWNGLLITESWNPPEWVNYLVCTVLLSTNFLFTYGYSANCYKIKPVLKATVIFASLNFIVSLVFPGSLIHDAFIWLCFVGFSLITNRSFHTVKRFVVITLAGTAYQLLSSLPRIGLSVADVIETPSIAQAVMYSVDLIVVLSTVYFTGGVKYYGYQMELPLRAESFGSVENDSEDIEQIELFNRLQGFQRLKAIALLLLFHVFQFGIILVACALGNVFVEGLVMVCSFLIYRLVIKRGWHSRSLTVCTVCTVLMFYVSAKAIPAFGYSQLFPVVVGLLLIYGLYRISLYTDSKSDSK